MSQSPRRFEHLCHACHTEWTAGRRISRCPVCHPPKTKDAAPVDGLPPVLHSPDGVAWKVEKIHHTSPLSGHLAWLKQDMAARVVKPAPQGATAEWSFKPGTSVDFKGQSWIVQTTSLDPGNGVTVHLVPPLSFTTAKNVAPYCIRCLKAGVPLVGKDQMCVPCDQAVKAKLNAGRLTPQPGCVSCFASLLPGQLPGSRCRRCQATWQKNQDLKKKKEEEARRKAFRSLPVVQQDELIKATKYAKLCLDKDGKPYFAGIGYGQYYTESEARCALGMKHAAPDPDCTCGFWVGTRDGSRLATWSPTRVALEVELAGTVLECARDGTPDTDAPWGYRAQWQRVLSVALPAECGWAAHKNGAGPSMYSYYGLCTGPPKFLCAADTSAESLLVTACDAHVESDRAIKNPVSFLRTFLQTEIRPGTVTDDAVPPKSPGEAEVEQLRKDWAQAVRDITGRMVKLEQLPLPMLIVPVGSARTEVVNGITYTLKGTASGWEIDRVDCPELDALKKRAEEIQKLYRQGKLTRKQVESLSTYVNLI